MIEASRPLPLRDEAAQEHPSPLVHVVFEANEAALPVREPAEAPPHFEVAPYDALLLFKENGLVHGAPCARSRSMHQGPLRCS